MYRRNDAIKTEDLFFDSQKWEERLTDISKRTPKKMNGLEYAFESGKIKGFSMDVKCFFGTIVSVLKHDGVVEGGTGEMKKREEKEIVSK